MVASILALGGFAGNGSASGIAEYFTGDCNGEYYINGGQPPGVWFGDGARALGLTGTVDRGGFENLLAGRSPDGSRVLTQSKAKLKRFREGVVVDDRSPLDPTVRGQAKKRRREHNPGYDLTLSVPKSVSTWWAVADRQTQQEIDRVIDEAARRVLTFVQDDLQLGRRGLGGREEERAGLVVGMFSHYDNRNGDPQRHIHCTVLTPCQRTDGSWASINGAKLRDWTRTIGPMFRCELATLLQQRSGVRVGIEQTPGQRNRWFELQDVPRPLMKNWSSRREEILQQLKEDGLDAANVDAKTRTRANLETRQAKNDHRPLCDKQSDWRQAAADLGYPELRVRDRQRFRPRALSAEEFAQIVADAAARLHEQNASFVFRDLLKEVCEASEARGVTGRDLYQRLRDTIGNSPELRCLGALDREPHYCTQQMWRLEQRLIGTAERMTRRQGAVVSDAIREPILKRNPELTAEQVAAIRILTGTKSELRGLAGVAGAGKTRSMEVTREIFEGAGYRVIGGALSGAAKEELATQAGVQSRTVASYLHQLDRSALRKIADRVRHDVKQLVRAAAGKSTSKYRSNPLGPKTVVLLDEAGMIDTRLMQKMLRHAARSGATVILAGDSRQLQPIGPGAPFRHLEQRIPMASLNTNRRQKDPSDRRAVGLLRDGKAAAALENYASRDRLLITSNRRRAEQTLLSRWAKSGGLKHPADNFIFTQTRAEARQLNRQCQQLRQREGRVASDQCAVVGEQRYFRGDRVMFHEADRSRGIENGYRGTVLNARRDLLVVRLDREVSAAERARGQTQVVTIPLRELQPESLTLGYAATTHKMQGNTVSHSFLLLGGKMTSSELAYVQATRAREQTWLFCDRQTAGDDLSDLVRSMSRSRAKQMAHEISEQSSAADKDRRRSPELRPELTIERQQTLQERGMP